MSDTGTDEVEWLRRHQVADRWGVSGETVANVARRHNVRTKTIVTERRYHSADVDRALREMQGEAVVTQAVRRLTEGSWAAGRSIWDADPATAGRYEQEIISVGPQPAPEQVAAKLGLPPGAEVIVRRRRYRVDGRLVLLAVAHLPADLAAGTAMAQPDSGPGGIWRRLADIGHRPATAPETVASRGATDYEAAQLQVEPGSPVLEILRVASTADGRAVDVSELTALPGYFRRYPIDL